MPQLGTAIAGCIAHAVRQVNGYKVVKGDCNQTIGQNSRRPAGAEAQWETLRLVASRQNKQEWNAEIKMLSPPTMILEAAIDGAYARTGGGCGRSS
jgi:hypothetical protein